MSGPNLFDVGQPTGPWRKVAEYDVPDTRKNRAMLKLADDAEVATDGMIPCMEERQPAENGYRVRVLFAGKRETPLSLSSRYFRDQIRRAAETMERCARILHDEFNTSTQIVVDYADKPIGVRVYFGDMDNEEEGE